MLQQQHQKRPYTTELTDDEANHLWNIEIGIPEAATVKLREKGVNRIEDLVDFNVDAVSTIAESLRKPGGLASSGGSSRIAPVLASAPVVCIGAKAWTHLEAATHIMKNFKVVNLKLSVSLLRYDTIIKNIKLEFDDIKERRKKEVSTPQISQKLDVVR